MTRYEYKVVPAPQKGVKARGARSTAARFAHALTQAINDEARQGWEYMQSETLPVLERKGLTGKTTVDQTVLVFRKALGAAPDAPAAESGVTLTTDTEPRLSAAPASGAAPSLGPARGSDDATDSSLP